MKKLFLMMILAALFGCTSTAQVEWQPIEKVAKEASTKMIFVDFSTSWCGWCKKMDKETFSDPVVAAILNQYYRPVHFNAEGDASFSWNGTTYRGAVKGSNGRPSTHPFTYAILGQRIGYPSFAVFNKDKGLVQILQGYQSAYDFQVVLWYLCSGDKEKYSFEEYQQIFDKKIKPVMMQKLGLAK